MLSRVIVDVNFPHLDDVSFGAVGKVPVADLTFGVGTALVDLAKEVLIQAGMLLNIGLGDILQCTSAV